MKKNNLTFFKFITQKEILVIAFGLIISDTINNFVFTSIEVFLDPFINNLFGKKNKDNKIKIGNIEIELGKFLIEFINLFVIMYLLFIITKKFNLIDIISHSHTTHYM